MATIDTSGQLWWTASARGLAAAIFGLAVLAWPGLNLTIFTLLFGAYAVVDGVLAVLAGLRLLGAREVAWPFLLTGLIGIVAGIVTLAYPGLTGVALLYVIAVWGATTGILAIIAGSLSNAWLVAFSGVLGVALSFLLVGLSAQGAPALAVIVGTFGVVYGLVGLAEGLRLLAPR